MLIYNIDKTLFISTLYPSSGYLSLKIPPYLRNYGWVSNSAQGFNTKYIDNKKVHRLNTFNNYKALSGWTIVRSSLFTSSTSSPSLSWESSYPMVSTSTVSLDEISMMGLISGCHLLWHLSAWSAHLIPCLILTSSPPSRAGFPAPYQRIIGFLYLFGFTSVIWELWGGQNSPRSPSSQAPTYHPYKACKN